METNFDVIVIGGGAAGLMAAGVAAEHGEKVLLLEKNSILGQKLRITGGGRCNITNAEKNLRTFLARYGEAEPFLHSAFATYINLKSPSSLMLRLKKFLPATVK